jgi:hypothetical protein
MPTTQEQLEETHKSMRDVAQLWVDELITDKEIASNFAYFHSKLKALEVGDLLDPNTGLRYPTTYEYSITE